MVKEAIEERRGERRIVIEDLGPVLVGAIGRDDHGAMLVAFADDLEKQIGAMLVDRQIAEFVDDQKARLEILVQFTLQIAMRLCCRE